MKNYDEIRDELSHTLRKACLKIVKYKKGEKRVTVIKNYFLNTTLHPHVTYSTERAMCDYHCAPSEDWKGFSHFLIDWLTPLAVANEIHEMRDTDAENYEKIRESTHERIKRENQEDMK